MELLLWIENTSALGWVRESSSIFAYPTILFLHTLGLATVVGLSAFVNLQVLGVGRGMPFTALKPFMIGIWIAFGVTAASGTSLFLANVESRMTLVFLVKLVLVALAITSLHLMSKQVFRGPAGDQSPVPRRAHLLAAASLIFWIGATTAGRLMAYIV